LARLAATKGDLAAAIEHIRPVVDFGKRIGHPLAAKHQAIIDEWRRRLESGGS